MDAISIIGWKNEHELNYFPFTAPLVSDQGIEMPNGLFVDAQIVSVGSPSIRLKTVTIASDSVFVELQVVGSSTKYLLTSKTFINDISSVGANVVDSNGLSCGKLIFGRDSCSIAKKTLNRIYSFNKKEYFLEPSCVLSLGQNHVTGVIHSGVKYRGAVTLKEGNGVSITQEVSGTTTVVKINAIGSSIDECCKDDYLPLKKINMVSSDLYGNIIIGVPSTDEPSNKDSLRETIKVVKTSTGIKLEIA